jgi:1-deoxy-D-xylulose-5-phosphate synthase
VTECLNNREVMLPILQLGLPDRFVDHGKHGELLKECGLDPEGIRNAIASRLDRVGKTALTAIK